MKQKLMAFFFSHVVSTDQDEIAFGVEAFNGKTLILLLSWVQRK